MALDAQLVGRTRSGEMVYAPSTADGHPMVAGAPPMHAWHIREVAAAGNYDAGDMISNSVTAASATAWKLKMGRQGGDTGHIVSIWVNADEDSLTFAPHIYLFARQPDRTSTPFTDNEALAIGARDMEYYLGRVTLPSMRDEGGISHSMTDTIMRPYRCDDAGYLWAIMVASTAETAETANMRVLLGASGFTD